MAEVLGEAMVVTVVVEALTEANRENHTTIQKTPSGGAVSRTTVNDW